MSRASRAEIGRLDPKSITDLAGLKKVSDAWTRFRVLVAVAYLGLGATLVFRRDIAVVLPVSVVVAAFLMVRLDLVRLRWLLAEVLGARYLPYAVPADSHGEDPARDEPVPAAEIRAGDLICTLSKHKEMAELAERQPQQWREQGLGRWYSPVLAIGAESGRIKLGVLGREEPHHSSEDKPEDALYYKRRRPLYPEEDSRRRTRHSAEAATALTGVLDFLSQDEVSEDELARLVASEYGCSDWAVRNAISVALAAKLAVRRHEPWIAFEVARLFASPVELGGHRACKIRLTLLGQLWQQSHPRAARAEPAGADTRRELLAEGRRVARSMALPGQAPPAAGITGEDELLAFAREMIGKFRHWVEGEGGWRVLWEGKPDEGRVMPGPKMQLIFLGVVGSDFKRAGLRLDREVETGRGPVDFTVTGDRRARVLIEMKRLSNTDFWRGLQDQTPIYMRGQEVRRAIFLAIRDSDTPAAAKRWEALQGEAAAVRAETGLAIEVERIDMLPKPSASKA
jgi:hypothetical protein